MNERRMNERRIRRLFLEHVQELADVDSLQVYVHVPKLFTSLQFAEYDRKYLCRVIGSFLLPFASMKKVVNYIQFCEGTWIMVDLTEETKEMRKHNENWLVDYVEAVI